MELIWMTDQHRVVLCKPSFDVIVAANLLMYVTISFENLETDSIRLDQIRRFFLGFSSGL